MSLKPHLSISPAVQSALDAGRPVVALESTIITHGMPYPQNLEMAQNVERVIAENGAVPATIAIMDGKFMVGTTAADLERLAQTGGKAAKAKVTDDMLHMVDVVRPKLVADGMFLVGLDIVGDKLMEINVFSPGGLGSAQSLVEVDFAPIIIEELERKVRIRKHNPGLDNRSLATS